MSVARIDKESFQRLVKFLANHGALKDSHHVCAAEKVCIFIHALVGFSIRQTAERWQHSISTISNTIRE